MTRAPLSIRVLGPYGGSAPGCPLTTFLIAGETALDAGALTESLSLQAQRRVRRVLLTHAHLDHVSSLPFLAANRLGAPGEPLEILAPEPVLEALRRHVFNDALWPDFARLPSPERPTIRFRALAEGRAERAGPLTVAAWPVRHVVPSYGYVVTGANERTVVFSGDTAPTELLWEAARRAKDVAAIFLECSFSNEEAPLAADSMHLTPRLVFEELSKLPPRVPVYLYHLKPFSLARVRREIAASRDSRLELLEPGRVFRF